MLLLYAVLFLNYQGPKIVAIVNYEYRTMFTFNQGIKPYIFRIFQIYIYIAIPILYKNTQLKEQFFKFICAKRKKLTAAKSHRVSVI